MRIFQRRSWMTLMCGAALIMPLASPYAEPTVPAWWPYIEIHDASGRRVGYLVPTSHHLGIDRFAINPALTKALGRGSLLLEAMPSPSRGEPAGSETEDQAALLKATPPVSALSDNTKKLLRDSIASGRFAQATPTVPAEVTQEILMKTPVLLMSLMLAAECLQQTQGAGNYPGVESRLVTLAKKSVGQGRILTIDLTRSEIFRSVGLATWDRAIAEALVTPLASCGQWLTLSNHQERLVRCGRLDEAARDGRGAQQRPGATTLTNAVVNAPGRQAGLLSKVMSSLNIESPPVIALGAMHVAPSGALVKSLNAKGFKTTLRAPKC